MLAGSSVYLFERGRVNSQPLVRFSINIIQVKSVNLFLHELWRLVIANKAVLVILFGLAMQLLHISNYHLFITKEEAYYYQAVETAKQQDDPIEWAMQRLDALSKGGSVEQVSAMNRLLVLLIHAESRAEQSGKRSIVYDTPYKTLLVDAADRNAVNTLLLMVLILLSIIPIREQTFCKLFHTTVNGRRKLFLTKSLTLLMVSGAILTAVYLPELIAICSAYNADDFTASVKALPFLRDAVNVPIYAYLILVYGIRFIAITGISFLAMLFSRKGIYAALVWFSVLFLLPALLHVFDMEVFRYYPSNWFLGLTELPELFLLRR